MIRRPPISTLTDTLLPSPQPFRSSILRQLVAAGFLSLDVAGHGGLSVTPPGAGLLQGQGSFRFRRDTVGKASQRARRAAARSEEHTSELQSLMRSSYAVFCLKKKKRTHYTYLLNKSTTCRQK